MITRLPSSITLLVRKDTLRKNKKNQVTVLNLEIEWIFSGTFNRTVHNGIMEMLEVVYCEENENLNSKIGWYEKERASFKDDIL